MLALTLSELHPTFTFCLHILAAYLICLIGINRNKPKDGLIHTLYFFLISAALGGTLYALYTLCGSFAMYNGIFYAELSATPLILCAILIATLLLYCLSKTKARNKAGHCYLKLCHGGRCFNVYCLIDSGNLLVCPYTALPVAIISRRVAASLLTAEEVNALETETVTKGLRLIPVSGIGGTALLPSFIPEEASICVYGEKSFTKKQLCVAIQRDTADFDKYDGIVPASLI